MLLFLLPIWLLSASPKPLPKGRVLVFLNTECPISQQYARRLASLSAAFGPKGVRFEALYPSPTDVPTTIRTFHQTYRLPFAGHPDSAHRQVRRYQAQTTPEVVVLGAAGQVIYRGAIDDWYVALGRHRPEPTQHYLRDALDALLTNRPIEIARTLAVGCLIE